jgi:hypothetical protein
MRLLTYLVLALGVLSNAACSDQQSGSSDGGLLVIETTTGDVVI